MKKLLICLFLLAPLTSVFAVSNTDSLVYQLQRKKINGLLEERSRKFGQYTQSLDQHTGIFGWQTKKDIKRSGEILMDIVQTDNNIFKELKILFDYKNVQQTQVQQQSHESESQLAGYMLTINKLRQQNEILVKQQNDQESALKGRQTTLYIIIVLLVFTSVFMFTKRNRIRKR
ncbi:hypothetical protein KXQ82_17435 [Mucilaginibacter sp. HMF5004]|uniref:hypothetical protein n=1 Tax=Mucilaginibacter rivuli TaxID=2857527 RepID=UPI001C5D35B2|nr:hypothetical protein [Mucilaginibacter rivuli]MBW4891514.1 hypothetical protein [Mucilaginibacter rivuli]